MRFRQLAVAASTRFLPAAAVLLVAVLVAEPIIRRRGIVDTLRQIYLPLAISEPILLSLGALAALLLLRNHLEARVLLSFGHNALAAFVAIVALFAISVLSQGAHMPFIIAVNVLAGVCGALTVFGASRTTTPAMRT
jgi:hypothetical protein